MLTHDCCAPSAVPPHLNGVYGYLRCVKGVAHGSASGSFEAGLHSATAVVLHTRLTLHVDVDVQATAQARGDSHLSITILYTSIHNSQVESKAVSKYRGVFLDVIRLDAPYAQTTAV